MKPPAKVKGATGRLAEYQAKRRFDTTGEPPGAEPQVTSSNGFVVQKHAARRLHYDFRLELDGVLKSWAVTRGPSYHRTDKRLAVRVEDHPVDYANFEGTIPQGQYGGGTVMVWDRGKWQPDGDPHEGLAAGKLAFSLDGEKLHGRWALVRMRPDAKSKRENWLLIKEIDDYADQPGDVLDQAASVLTGRSLDQIAAGAAAVTGIARVKPARTTPARATLAKPRRKVSLAGFTAPALATLTDTLPTGAGWVFEIKYDGYRAQIAADGEQVRLYSRSGLDWTDRFGPIVAAVAQRNFDRVLIDAEIVVLDGKGRSDFGLLQIWLQTGTGAPACYAFDLLEDGGRSVTKQTFRARRDRLLALIGEDEAGPLHVSTMFEPDDPAPLLAETCRQGLEGLIAKRADASYHGGRTANWLKIKCGHQQEFIVIGWAASERRAFSSLLLGVHENGAMRYAGRVGTGFSQGLMAELEGRFRKLAVKRPAVAVPAAIARTASFVTPSIIVEVRFAGWTRDNLVRQGSVLGIREDKQAASVTREVARAPAEGPCRIAGITISHPDKPLFHDADGAVAATKAELAAYLEAVGPTMARYAANRFTSLLRAPRGAGGKGFFQRHAQPGLTTFWKSKHLAGDTTHGAYIYFTDPHALVEAAQMDTLEFHIWGSHTDRPDRPDRIVFDLDPAPDVDFATVKQGARDVRSVLDALGLTSLPLLSGGKGLHVVVPIAPLNEWPVVKRFAANVAAQLSIAEPARYVATMTKSKRTGHIFIDHFRNDRTASAVAPYSPRDRPGGPVAWPLVWDDLDTIEQASSVTMAQARKLLEAGDPWRDYDRIEQELTVRMIEAVTGSGKK